MNPLDDGIDRRGWPPHDRLIASIGLPWLNQSGNHLMPSPWPRNRLTEMLAIEYPIVQGPLGGLSSQRLTAAVSNFGGLGSFGAHSLSPDAIRGVIGAIRALTSRPFAVNLWVSMEDDGAHTSDEAAYNRSLLPFHDHFAALGVPLPAYKPYVPARPDVRHVPIEEARAKMGPYADALALDQVVRSPRARALGWAPTLHSVAGNTARLLDEWRAARN